jgi:arginyl-tRNA synthetase
LDASRSEVIVRGPIENALALVIAERLGHYGADPESNVADVEPTTKAAVGDFRVDLRAVLGSRTPVTKSLCREVAGSLLNLDGVERATAIPPRVYLKVGTEFLYEQVVSAVLRAGEAYGSGNEGDGKLVIVSFSSPNANKPLHLGHLRNNFIGMALANLLGNGGYEVMRGEVISNWGIHICQAVVAYQKWAKGSTPQSSEVRGDRFVGSYYVMFHEENEKLKRSANGESAEVTDLEREAAALLDAMEAGDEELCRLNELLTGWAEDGIRQTYSKIGTALDLVFYERDTLAGARKIIEEAVAGGVCRRRADGSVFIDLSDRGLEEVTLLRRNGSPLVYATLLGFCVARFEHHAFDKVVSVFGQQWEAGAAVVDEILLRLGYDWVPRMERILYGMVGLPEGKMKSRQGVVVEADEMLDDVVARLSLMVREGSDGRLDSLGPIDPEALAVGLVKYHFLAVKRIKEVVYDERLLWERTLPRFAQVLQILSLAEREGGSGGVAAPGRDDGNWRALLLQLNAFPRAAGQAAAHREPAELVRYLDETCFAVKACRSHISDSDRIWQAIAIVIRRCLSLLNIKISAK